MNPAGVAALREHANITALANTPAVQQIARGELIDYLATSPQLPSLQHSGSVQLQPFKLSRIPVGVIMHFGLNPNNNARDVIHNICTTPECPWRIVHDAPYAMLITLIPEQTWNSFATVAEREWRNRSVAAPRINGNGSTSLSAALERHGHTINFPA